MRKSIHCIRFRFALFGAVLLVLALGGSPALAQGAGAPSRHDSAQAADIVRDPADVPPPVGNRSPATVKVELAATEVVGELDPANHTTYRYWTFNGKVPGPMIRVRQGDTVEVTLRNNPSSHMVHSVDFHAAIGAGGGAALSQVLPGTKKTFTFQATTPGLFVYHCGTPMIADHIANGMYGLILVEPAGGLPHVDHEFYVMQGEVYTSAPNGHAGLQAFSEAKLMQESPEYFLFNGAVGALTQEHPLRAKTGDAVRIFFGNAGPNATSSPHIVGEIFTRDYLLGSLTSPPAEDVQTASVPPGGAAILELKAMTSGQFNLMDHAMARMAKGLMATLDVTGAQNATVMHPGPASSAGATASNPVSGITQADSAAAAQVRMDSGPATADRAEEHAGPHAMPGMPPNPANVARGSGAASVRKQPGLQPNPPVSDLPITSKAGTALNGCLTLMSDGKVMLKLLHSEKTYRLEGQPLRFDENDQRLVHVTGYFGSVVLVEDSHVPSFVVEALTTLEPNCSANISPAVLRKLAAVPTARQPGMPITIGMSEMRFLQPELVVNVGEVVTWKNSSSNIHNVVADPAKALVAADVRLPHGAQTFDSGFLQPGQSFTHRFTIPGVYRYVCTLHEGAGMKGVVVVKAPATTNLASRTAPNPDGYHSR
ncbi:MAG TPA: copper-containing nitrite reductase [Candidatus Binatia bacterium]|nr:copper-containing nitrite reductase [Candidatus Binatia bacterium]